MSEVDSKNDSYCLGIESTADDFGAAIVTFDGKILSNANDAYLPKAGGIHPREAARHHAKVAGDVISAAFQEASIKPRDIAIVAFSQGPGMGPCLRTGPFQKGRPIVSDLDT